MNYIVDPKKPNKMNIYADLQFMIFKQLQKSEQSGFSYYITAPQYFSGDSLGGFFSLYK